MVTSLPIKKLIKLNGIISFMVSLMVFICFFEIIGDAYNSLIRFFQSLLFLIILSFVNSALLKLFLENNQTKKKYARIKFYLCSYSAAFIVWLLIKDLHAVITGIKPEAVRTYTLAFLSVWFLNTLIIVLQDMVILQYKKTQAEIENLQLKANVSETSNLLLRQQIHPHFLFNALNTVKSLYKKDLQQGEDYLVHLANFLRVSISNHTTKTTLIKNELDFCLDYLKMQKIRFGEAMEYSAEISDETMESCYLPFFSLQPLVENALKHNVLTEERPILITIEEQQGYLVVSNNIQSGNYKEKSTGHGLSNLAERYRLLGEEEIGISFDDNFFTVSIKILAQ